MAWLYKTQPHGDMIMSKYVGGKKKLYLMIVNPFKILHLFFRQDIYLCIILLYILDFTQMIFGGSMPQ